MHLLDDFYPAGDEQVLVYEVLGTPVPEGGIPLDVGAVVMNVETLFNIGRALSGQSVMYSYFTVAGEVARPAHVVAPIGASIADVVETLGGVTVPDWMLVDGGVMMGSLQETLDRPVLKTTKGLIILPKNATCIENRRI